MSKLPQFDWEDGIRVTAASAPMLLRHPGPGRLMAVAAGLRDQGHRNVISYSRKVFIPLTQLCRDVCHYCTFAHPPRPGEPAFMSPDAVLAVARAGQAAGCKEALFTLGDKPELRYRVARDQLKQLGHATTLSYLAEMAALVLAETGLLPHLNPGVMSAGEIADLRCVSVSQGIMLETVSPRLRRRPGPHFGSLDKDPKVRLATIETAGRLGVPFTSGLLIGIGETRRERIDSLLALRDLNDRYGHIQEIIIQNFRAKPSTRMAAAAEPSLDELLWTIAAARLIFGPEMNIQAPPNLSPGALAQIIGAGINDWGGVSPVSPDYVNPEAPWPHLGALESETEAAGKVLTQRLAIYPSHATDGERWLDAGLRRPVLRAMDMDGFARTEDWSPGADITPPDLPRLRRDAIGGAGEVAEILSRARRGETLGAAQIIRLAQSRGPEVAEICAAADALRAEVNGAVVTYAVNRNINYTNICYYRCQFCAFSKGRLSENLRGRPYDLSLAEIRRRTREAWDRGASEVCMQGGIHPDYTGSTYVEICEAVKSAVPEMHVHAFSPLEIWQGAKTLGIDIAAFLGRLQAAGLGSLPGTAAEILDDEVRAIICPDKLNTAQWFEVMDAAHGLGLKTTATIMFGHVDGARHWARHLLLLRRHQARTGGFT
ncbi:MAG: 7,8-didemethyl-8-hydroxy-5-deazariboflavin synthase CofG, partial [Rhodospirillales bacterium]